MVPMSDGVKLATRIFLPEGDGPFPVIFLRGPYGSGGAAQFAGRANPRGYAVVSQDMRGRFDSEGSDAVVFLNDGWAGPRDGQETLEWIAKQSWCNGRIGTTGGSALGITQNLLAPGAPPELRAQHVSVAFSDMYSQAAYQGGVWRKSLIETWLSHHKFDPLSLQSFREHPTYDAFWQKANADAQAHRVHSPAVYIGGWYDIFLQGTINSFVNVHHRGAKPARGNCRLILGPWAHGFFSELKYPPNAQQRPAAADQLRFFDHHLKGEDNKVPEDAPVHYYVMGDPTDANAPGNVWRHAENWPPPCTPTPYYFHQAGHLQTTPGPSAKLTYRYDPNDPVPTIGGQNLVLPKGPMDQRKLESRPDVLVFTTEVLEQPLEITGRITARLYVSSDCPDTDFTVKLTDVYPDGRSMLVTDGILRARFRNGFDREDFLEPGEVAALDVDLWSTSLILNRGHRLRIAVSSSNAPRFEPNTNTGQPTPKDGETRVAANTLHLGSEHASHIVLPIVGQADQ